MRPMRFFLMLLFAGLWFSLFASVGQAKMLREDFESGELDPAVLYYKDNFEQRAGSYRFVPGAGRDGSTAIELTLKEHCPPKAQDCSERAELWESKNAHLPYGTPVWYRFSVRFVGPRPDGDHRHVLAQWKRTIPKGVPGNSSPFLALRLRDGKLFFTVETELLKPLLSADGTKIYPCRPGETEVWNRPYDGQSRGWMIAEGGDRPARHEEYDACTDEIHVTRFVPVLPEAKDGWFNIVAFTRAGPDGDGRIELFVNGERVAQVTGRIGHHHLGPNQYFKFGPYRDAGDGTWSLLFDDFARSENCTDMLAEKICHDLGL
ncbi:hypothetical protein CKO32_03330 [Afifella marina DSM 2698]|uniref:Polysaccharide lyase n=2 Tax=Afifella marina TaxID=1080 RepID=A0A1G5MEW0_AFIMA|nr:hypothetical protein [Afifella marina DSM 2698]MBK1625587.1 hypothetical protein [Afifella marina]MBK5917410.1 hypothetical protein [Afifella marina]RAI23361.1 hypothetical protein CH311_00245 [Afifella marina DSM 2698]SCZ23211.1 Polysaccharide lyase [Afifella marina DSM 2698]